VIANAYQPCCVFDYGHQDAVLRIGDTDGMTVFIAFACNGLELQTFIVFVGKIEFDSAVNGFTAKNMLARDALESAQIIFCVPDFHQLAFA